MYTIEPFKEGELMAFSKAGTAKSSGFSIVNDPATPPSPNTLLTSEATDAKFKKALDDVKNSIGSAYQTIPEEGKFTPNTLVSFDNAGKLNSTPYRVDNASPPTANVLYDSLKIDAMMKKSSDAQAALVNMSEKIGNFMKLNGSSQVITGGSTGAIAVNLPIVDSSYGTAVTSSDGGLKLLAGGVYHIVCSLNMRSISSINFWAEFTMKVVGTFTGATDKKINLVPFSWLGEVLHENAQVDLYISCTSDCTVSLLHTSGTPDSTLNGTLETSSYLSGMCTGWFGTA